MKTKVCKKCGELKDISCFYISKTLKGGYDNSCKLCRYETGKSSPNRKINATNFREKNKDKIKERFNLNRDIYYHNRRLKYNSNKEEINTKRRALYTEIIKNKEHVSKINLYYRERYKTNPEPFKKRCLKYNSTEKGKAGISSRKKKYISNLTDSYVIEKIKRGTLISADTIRCYPELIEAKKIIIKTQRLCKTSKN